MLTFIVFYDTPLNESRDLLGVFDFQNKDDMYEKLNAYCKATDKVYNNLVFKTCYVDSFISEITEGFPCKITA